MSGHIQNEDVKSQAEIVAAGGSASQLINDTKIWLSGSSQRLDTAISAGFLAGNTFTATAGENLAANDAIYICYSASDPGSRTIGNAYKLDVTNGFRMIFAGFVQSAVSTGQSATIQFSSILSGFTGLTKGSQIFASVSSPGGYQAAAPATTSLIVPLGQCVNDTTKIIINAALFAANFGTQPLAESFLAVYFAGAGANVTSTDKLTLSNESISAVSSTIPLGLNSGAGVVGSDRGYIIGGGNTNGARQNVVVKLTFPSDVYSTTGATLGQGIQGSIPTQSSTKGYAMGGDPGGTTNAIDSVQFSNDTRVAVSATLPTAARASAGITNGTTAGYTMGDNNANLNSIQKLVFSGETTSTIAATISTSTGACLGNYSPTNGYREGGASGGTVIDRLAFSGEARTTLAAVLSTSYSHGLGHSGSNKGYCGGGGSTTINALVFATETNGAISAVLNNARADSGSGLRN